MPSLRIDATHLRDGVVGSLAVVVVFGLIMTMMGRMPMVAMLVRSESVVVGWIVHLVISALFGIALAYLLANLRWHRIVTGLAWGVAAWVGGALILMPIFLGMPGRVFHLASATPWWSLLGHLMYGLVAGVVAWQLALRAGAGTTAHKTAA